MSGSHVPQDRFHLVDKGRHLSSFFRSSVVTSDHALDVKVVVTAVVKCDAVDHNVFAVF